MSAASKLIAKALPRPAANFLWNLALDARSIPGRLSRPNGPPLPWNVMHNVGGADYFEIGRNLLTRFRRIGGLEPHHHVLDIGCGTGRLALPLADFLAPGARYVGFDVSRRAIAWCEKHIAPRRDGFAFHHADIANPEYNPRGAITGAAFDFPCAAASIDFAFATSVFTHMPDTDVTRYLHETARALRPGGRGVATFFVLTETAVESMAAGRAIHRFQPTDGAHWVVDPAAPGQAVGFEEAWLRRAFAEAGLAVIEPIELGGWSRGGAKPALQDLIAFEKAP